MLNLFNLFRGRFHIIQGGAKGGDDQAWLAARKLNVPAETMKPNWNRDGKRAGVMRNILVMSIMNRNEAINLLRSAGVEEAQINEDAILIASIVGTVVIRAYAKLLAEKAVEHVISGAEYADNQ